MASDLTATEREPEANDVRSRLSPVGARRCPPRRRAPARLPLQHPLRRCSRALLGLAVAGVAIYATARSTPAPAWSAWKPSGGGLGAAKQIADHVGEHVPPAERRRSSST